MYVVCIATAYDPMIVLLLADRRTTILHIYRSTGPTIYYTTIY